MPSALEGLRILEPAPWVAAPRASTILGDFGAEVIKVEMPVTGDVMRGVSAWWPTLSRNKKSVTLNLRHPKGQELFLKLAEKSDVVIENFRPGTMEKWGLGWEVLHKVNQGLILARGTGFGQYGPYAHRPTYGNTVASFSGLASIQQFADTPPFVPSVIGDHLPPIMLACGIMIAAYHRDVRGGQGQIIDAATTEALLTVSGTFGGAMFAVQQGIPGRQARPSAAQPGTVSTAVVGSFGDTFTIGGIWRTKDRQWVDLYTPLKRFFDLTVTVMGREDLICRPSEYPDDAARRRCADEIRSAIEEWFAARTRDEVLKALLPHDIPVAPVYDISDVMEDPHFLARDMVITVDDADLGPVKMVGVVPKFSETPGQVKHSGPRLGEHNEEIYQGLLGLSSGEIEALRAERII